MRCHNDYEGGWKDAFSSETHRTEPIPGRADTAGSRHPRPNTILCSRNVLGLAKETITSAGNRLAHSEFHTSHKSPEDRPFSNPHVWERDTQEQWESDPHPDTSVDPKRTCCRD